MIIAFCLAVEVVPSSQRRLRADCEGHQEQPALSNSAFHAPRVDSDAAVAVVTDECVSFDAALHTMKNDRSPYRSGRTTEIPIHRLTIEVS
jgi:hypothetical protein